MERLGWQFPKGSPRHLSFTANGRRDDGARSRSMIWSSVLERPFIV